MSELNPMRYYKSVAAWPRPAVNLMHHENWSEDTHATWEAADAVCQMLKKQGFGGDGKIFPLWTRVDLHELNTRPTPAPPLPVAEGEEESRHNPLEPRGYTVTHWQPLPPLPDFAPVGIDRTPPAANVAAEAGDPWGVEAQRNIDALTRERDAALDVARRLRAEVTEFRTQLAPAQPVAKGSL